MHTKIHIITGPTAVGKTQFALDWARMHDAEIISCDSLLVYKGMDIGTAKPTLSERAGIVHHLIDCVPVDESFSIGRYVTLARQAAESIVAKGKSILVTGGSGFYLKAFLKPVFDTVSVPAAIEIQVDALYKVSGNAAILDQLKSLNPNGLGTLDIHNPRRTTRALKRCLTTGNTLAAMAAEFKTQPSAFADYTITTTYLTRPLDQLNERIADRVDTMIQNGLIDEVRHLQTLGIQNNPSAANAIGYRETLTWLQAPTSLKQLAETITHTTRHLAKKQRTWFRYQIPIDHTIEL